ncbi:GDP-L-fucose synthase family protein [Methylophaga nitratireducenticrescens]|uniref:GDP-L-fucose synthase family protein n=1 Tax=Methylophaga nitratireducenticrescens TaxID=754476 RepID=UPI000CDBEC09|nr:GDP-L-fucose synthase [Methylophaga nitratireducenticrescens]AUZ84036.1 GDP-fucose synthetase [Methylophaga nitratireducenticrescens]
MDKNAKIYVAGHRGLVGSALIKKLEEKGYNNLVKRSHAELDLTDDRAVANFFKAEKPDYVFLAAAKVGGIYANNTYPAEFIRDNLAIQNNVIHHAYLNNVKRLLFLGSSCIYPKNAPQPLKEEYLLTGPLEETNRPYALAKIAGIEMCWSYNRQYRTQYLAVMPTNLYGPDDNYDLNNSHVLPALIRKFHLAKLAGKGDLSGISIDEKLYGQIPEPMRKNLLESCSFKLSPEVTIWGTGMPRREFMYSEDMADACVHLMNLEGTSYQQLLGAERNNGIAPVVNVGVGSDVTIKELAEIIKDIVGFNGNINFDTTKHDGTSRKLMCIDKMEALGIKSKTLIKSGIAETYKKYLSKIN